MSIPAAANPLLLASAASTQYTVSRSLRFNSSDSAYLSRTPASAGNRKTWTWSGWVKRTPGSYSFLLSATSNPGSVDDQFRITDTDSLSLFFYNGSQNASLVSTAVFRDPSAWYHIICAVDTTQATAANRVKLYVNGAEVTAFSTASYPAQNYESSINGANPQTIGSRASGSFFTNSLYADVHFIDGQALTPSSFTETSATTGQLIPKRYTGTFTGNSFWLQFADNSSNTATTLGKDSSGLGNNWTPFNLQTTTGGPTSVAAASGALPILNTTDTYGTTVGTGVASDSSASSLQLALPMGTASGLSLTDQSPSGRTSATKTITNSSVINSTSISKFYSGSADFQRSLSANLRVAGTGLTYPVNSTDSCTVEFWLYMKTASLATRQFVVGKSNWGNSTSSYSDGIRIEQTNSSWAIQLGTIAVTPTITAANGQWAHFAAVRNGATLTAYVNGVQVATTSGATTVSAVAGDMIIGNQGTASGSGGLFSAFLDGYVADFRYYVGVAKYTSNFNPPNSTQNATVAAGNDSLVDTPSSAGTDSPAGGVVTGNYCTWNPLLRGQTGTPVYTNGNLDASATGNWAAVGGTIGISSGKYYWETTITTAGSSNQSCVGLLQAVPSFFVGYDTNSWGYFSDGRKFNSSQSSYGASYTVGDVVGVAFDRDAGTLTFYKNGASQGTAFTGLTNGVYFPATSHVDGSVSATNFGQRPFAYQNAGVDRPASTFKALCDTNLPAPVVAKPETVFQVIRYTGNGSTQTIPNVNTVPTTLGFSPDLVWIKARSSAIGSAVVDSVRGSSLRLFTELTSAEDNVATVTSLNSDGFGVSTAGGLSTRTNDTNVTYAAWCWDAGSAANPTTINANAYSAGVPSITSSVRANPTAGFSIVGFNSGSSGQQTIGHGLGVAPSLIIAKTRTASTNWTVYHSSVTNVSQYLVLNSTQAVSTLSNIWGTTAPTSTVFGFLSGTNQSANADCIAYCFAPVNSYSAFGSYQGNGSADGPFQWCGFRPRWLLLKRSDVGDAGTNWIVLDATRNPSNVVGEYLLPNTADGGASTTLVDILSNGFKLRVTGTTLNNSGGTYVWAAFAESPFAYSRAR